MQLVCDLHLHSKYSRAVSPQMVLPEMARWANLKGIDILGTGDSTHPLWIREIKSFLEPVEEGLFKLKNADDRSSIPTKFLLTTEISSIYSQGGKLRRIHNLILAPSLETVEKINSELLKRGCNLSSDGRPIIGINSRDLTALVSSIDSNCLLIPAHIWTPWFSLYGSQSGFDSMEECFGDMSKYIYGVETGLSSDPSMNWRIPDLDNRSILSFSDSHSGAKLGREATVLRLKDQRSKSKDQRLDQKSKTFCYEDLARAIKQDSNCDWEIGYTVEFYPEEGKYHYTGHRNCHVRQSPEETKRMGTTCHVCGKKLTIGVMHRVEELAKSKIKNQRSKIKIDGIEIDMIVDSENKKKPYIRLVPLQEILAESIGSPVASRKVQEEYSKLVNNFASEFNVLLFTDVSEIEKVSGKKTAEGVKKVRSGDIYVDPGYDGEFGKVKIWSSSVRPSDTDGGKLAGTGEAGRSQLTLDF